MFTKTLQGQFYTYDINSFNYLENVKSRKSEEQMVYETIARNLVAEAIDFAKTQL